MHRRCVWALLAVWLLCGVKAAQASPTNIMWVDLPANARVYNNEQVIDRVVARLADIHVDTIVVDAKAYTGYVGYRSYVAPHISKTAIANHQGMPAGFDWLQAFSQAARAHGLTIYANVNLFSEGHANLQDGSLYRHPQRKDWMTVYYDDVFPDTPPGVVRRSFTAFVNPILPDVQEYQLAVIRELLQYDIDGLILDRGRYANVFTDFSAKSQEAFRTYLGQPVCFPRDIFHMDPDALELVPGRYFPEWIQWRAANIHHFIRRVVEEVKGTTRPISLGAYVGSWYNHYYSEGANWARAGFQPDYEWAGPDFHTTGYADLLDLLMVGAYYPDVTVAEAEARELEDWQSVEGAMRLSSEVVGEATALYGSLYLLDYAGQPQQFVRAIEMAREFGRGVMLFDIIYVEQYDWWDLLGQALRGEEHEQDI